ncbi:hypothetical protein ILUMI_10357, partial [Ignelater luminosus]
CYLCYLFKWESDDAKAMLYIMITLDDETSTLVMTCTSAKEVRDSLISVFKQSSEQRTTLQRVQKCVGGMPSLYRTLKNLVEKLRTIEQRDSVVVQKAAFLSQTQNKPKQLLVNGNIKENQSSKSIKNLDKICNGHVDCTDRSNQVSFRTSYPVGYSSSDGSVCQPGVALYNGTQDCMMDLMKEL